MADWLADCNFTSNTMDETALENCLTEKLLNNPNGNEMELWGDIMAFLQLPSIDMNDTVGEVVRIEGEVIHSG